MTFERKTLLALYKKLLALYPRAFRERFGESMAQTFGDLCRERGRQDKPLSLFFLSTTFAETFAGIARERFFQIKKGATMENILSNSKSASVLGLFLALPLALMFLIVLSDAEPLNGYLKALTTEPDGYALSAFGKVFFLFLLLLLPVGFGVSLVPIVRNVRAGYGLRAHPFSFLVAALLFIFIAKLVVGFVVDQYPCWIGVPNCD